MFRDEAQWVSGDEFQEAPERLLRKYGRSTTWVFIAVHRNSQSAAQIPIILINRDREGQPGAIVRHGDRGLTALLERPNPHQSQMEFIEACIVSLELTGNLFVDKVDVDGDGRPEELYVLNPSRVTILPHPTQLVRGYIYTVNGKQIPLLRDEVLHLRYTNPWSDHYGLSKLTSARLAEVTDVAASQWNRTFLLKGGWPSGAIEMEAELDDEGFRRMKQQIKRSLSQGKDGAGRVLLLTGGSKYHAISLNPKDADWLDARRMSRDEIFMIFGLTPAAAGAFTNENTTTRSAGVEQQLKHYYRTTVCALVKRLLDAFNRDFVRAFAPNFKLVPDLRNVPALQDDVQTEYVRAQALRTLVSAGLSLNKALARLLPEVEPEAWGNVSWRNSAEVPISGDEAPALPSEQPAKRLALEHRGIRFDGLAEALATAAEDAEVDASRETIRTQLAALAS